MELLSNQLDKLTLKFELKAGDNDKLFGKRNDTTKNANGR